MNNILEYSYSIFRYNFVITFFLAMILIYFFASTLIKNFNDIKDYTNIINASEKICVKFNANGSIIDYNKYFEQIATLSDEDIKGVDMFKLIQFDDYEEMMKTLLISDPSSDIKFTTIVTCRNNERKKIVFKCIKNTNYLGADATYILIGTDITSTEKSEQESQYNKKLLKNLTFDYRFAEEELRRNFQQIQDTQEEIEQLRLRHKAFVHNLPLSIIEYDFNTRQIAFSSQLITYFVPNANTSTLHPDEAIVILYNFICKDSVYDMLQALYKALNNRTSNFTFRLNLNNTSIYIIANATVTYNDNEPTHIYVISKSYA